jgi:hypothetical protein
MPAHRLIGHQPFEDRELVLVQPVPGPARVGDPVGLDLDGPVVVVDGGGAATATPRDGGSDVGVLVHHHRALRAEASHRDPAAEVVSHVPAEVLGVGALGGEQQMHARRSSFACDGGNLLQHRRLGRHPFDLDHGVPVGQVGPEV